MNLAKVLANRGIKDVVRTIQLRKGAGFGFIFAK